MWAFIPFAAATAALIVMSFLLVNETAAWLDRRSYQRSQRIERGLARTHARLARLSQIQASLLDAHAHEAAVALILASYQASKEASEAPVTSIVVNNTTTSSDSAKGQPT